MKEKGKNMFVNTMFQTNQIRLPGNIINTILFYCYENRWERDHLNKQQTRTPHTQKIYTNTLANTYVHKHIPIFINISKQFNTVYSFKSDNLTNKRQHD